MKSTIVPAQVTTVEDKVAGNLSFTQLILLTVPVFLFGIVFTVVPPFLTFSPFKILVSMMIACICMTLAIRYNGRILAQWITTLAKYYLRARYFIYDKNDSYLRKDYSVDITQAEVSILDRTEIEHTFYPQIELAKLIQLETAVNDPRGAFEIKRSKKGILNVHIKEIK